MPPDLMSFNCGAGSAGSPKKLHTDYQGPVLLRAGRRVVPRNRPASRPGHRFPPRAARELVETRFVAFPDKFRRAFFRDFLIRGKGRQPPRTLRSYLLASDRRDACTAVARGSEEADEGRPETFFSSFFVADSFEAPSSSPSRGDLFSLVTTRHVLPRNTWPCLHFARAYALRAHACYLDAAAVYYFKVDDGEPVLSVAPCIV